MFKTLCACVMHLLPWETSLLSKLDSMIGSSENPNEAISISVSALLPRARPRPLPAQPHPRLFRPDVRREAMGSENETRGMNFKLS